MEHRLFCCCAKLAVCVPCLQFALEIPLQIEETVYVSCKKAFQFEMQFESILFREFKGRKEVKNKRAL
jgi:hypothetical protein